MSSFSSLYAQVERAAAPDRPSPELRRLLADAYEAIVARPYDVGRVVAATDALLAFLESPAGRTHANCVVTDYFFSPVTEWERLWEDAPGDLADILGDMGGALHDTVSAPETAENFDSTPEQLRARLRNFREAAGA